MNIFSSLASMLDDVVSARAEQARIDSMASLATNEYDYDFRVKQMENRRV